MQLDLTIPYGYCQCGCGGRTTIAKATIKARGIFAGEPNTFLPNHRKASRLYVAEDRGYESACWVWQGARQPNGYARMGRYGKGHLAHRFMYEQHIGPIPDGLVLDHLCRVRECVNPAHLEPVTHVENSARGVDVGKRRNPPTLATHCRNGHEYTPANTHHATRGRVCRACHRDRERERRARLVKHGYETRGNT